MGGAVEVRHPPTTHLRLPALCTATALLSGGNLFALAPLAMQLQNKKKRRKSPDHINSLFHCLCILSVLFFWAAFFLSPVEPVRIRMRHFVCHSHSTAADSRRCCASHPSCVGGSHCATVPPTRVHHAMYAA